MIICSKYLKKRNRKVVVIQKKMNLTTILKRVPFLKLTGSVWKTNQFHPLLATLAINFHLFNQTFIKFSIDLYSAQQLVLSKDKYEI